MFVKKHLRVNSFWVDTFLRLGSSVLVLVLAVET